MSNTPRTDANSFNVEEDWIGGWMKYRNEDPSKHTYTQASFARELELENARLKEDAVAQAEELRLALADVKRLLDRISDLKDEINGYIPEHGRRGM